MVQVQAKTVVKQLQRIVIVPRSAGPFCHPVYFGVVSVAVLFEPSTEWRRRKNPHMVRKAKKLMVRISRCREEETAQEGQIQELENENAVAERTEEIERLLATSKERWLDSFRRLWLFS